MRKPGPLRIRGRLVADICNDYSRGTEFPWIYNHEFQQPADARKVAAWLVRYADWFESKRGKK